LVTHPHLSVVRLALPLNHVVDWSLESFFGLAPANAKVCNSRGSGVARLALARLSAGAKSSSTHISELHLEQKKNEVVRKFELDQVFFFLLAF
jgi:hypothetical protein